MEKTVQRRQKKNLSLPFSELKEHINQGFLYQSKNQEWCIANKKNSEEIPARSYIFACMLTGFTRVAAILILAQPFPLKDWPVVGQEFQKD